MAINHEYYSESIAIWFNKKAMHVRPCEAKISYAKPENIILHVGTNDLNFEKTSSLIARSIINLAVSLKTKCSVKSTINKMTIMLFQRST